MVQINFEFEYVENASSLNERIKAALADKLTELTELAADKITENISGKILQKQSGALLQKVEESTEIDTASNPMTGFAGIAHPGPKEWALEKGGENGKGWYPIVPIKAEFLRFFSKTLGKIVYAKYVKHPPSKEFRYIGLVEDEMVDLVPEGFEEAITHVFRGGI